MIQHPSNQQPASDRDTAKRYRFGVVLSVGMGNMTRYLNFRKYAERDPEVDLLWAPVKHFIAPDEPNPFKYLPPPLYTRAVILYQSAPVLKQMHQLDVVLFHLFEAYVFACCRSLIFKQPQIIWNNDDPPVVNPYTYPLYPKDFNKSHRRHRFRLGLDLWCASRAAAFIPWSAWGDNILVNECGLSRDRVQPIHPGLDLERWTVVDRPPLAPGVKPKILFVGGDFERKGGDLLLTVFKNQFADRAELHLVTKEPPATTLPNVHVYTDIAPNDDRLAQLYAAADLFVLPTTADLSSWACLEAMASGCAVISTGVGGVGDIVCHGETGLVTPVGDETALAAAIQSLLDNPTLCRQMGTQGRKVVEQDFNASTNVPRTLAVMKAVADRKHMAKSGAWFNP
ncbi:MAG: glycosyltransferase family 4 protein [Leptolyngbya sp. BL-A-14]